MPTNHSTGGARSFVHRTIPDDPVNRHADDWYRTPPVATQALVDAVDLSGTTWEPACGDGIMAEVLRGHGREVVATDLHDRGYGTGGIDFLTHEPDFEFDHVVTNPPFTHALEFCAAGA